MPLYLIGLSPIKETSWKKKPGTISLPTITVDMRSASSLASVMILGNAYIKDNSTISDEVSELMYVADYVYPILAAFHTAEALNYEGIGCFDFEVTESMGTWLQENTGNTKFLVELGRQLDRYFPGHDCSILVAAAAKEMKGHVLEDIAFSYKNLMHT